MFSDNKHRKKYSPPGSNNVYTIIEVSEGDFIVDGKDFGRFSSYHDAENYLDKFESGKKSFWKKFFGS